VNRTAPDAPTQWHRIDHHGRAGTLHALEVRADAERSVWVMTLSVDALVLGSTQNRAVVAPGVLDGEAIDVVTRRSGGGAVLLGRSNTVWVDVVIPRDDPLWVDDVGRSFDWLGTTWAATLVRLGCFAGHDVAVHCGPLRRTPESDLVCFAGMGPGEVTVDGCKTIGLSQRRGREGARFQCLVHVGEGHPAAEIMSLLREPQDPERRTALRERLEREVVTVPLGAAEVIDTFIATLRS